MFVRNGQALGSVLHSTEPGAESPEPTGAEQVATPPETVGPQLEVPKHYDQKADWVAFVVAKTADSSAPVSEEDADAMTKADLIELYGG